MWRECLAMFPQLAIGVMIGFCMIDRWVYWYWESDDRQRAERAMKLK